MQTLCFFSFFLHCLYNDIKNGLGHFANTQTETESYFKDFNLITFIFDSEFFLVLLIAAKSNVKQTLRKKNDSAEKSTVCITM